jgi:hypothetical protein
MKPVDILEWTMGWAWPIIIGLMALMAWGIARIMTWREQDMPEEQPSGPIPGKHCTCQCDER